MLRQSNELKAKAKWIHMIAVELVWGAPGMAFNLEVKPGRTEPSEIN